MQMVLRMKRQNFVLAAEFPCEWKTLAIKFASDCECDGLARARSPFLRFFGFPCFSSFAIFLAFGAGSPKNPLKIQDRMKISISSRFKFSSEIENFKRIHGLTQRQFLTLHALIHLSTSYLRVSDLSQC